MVIYSVSKDKNYYLKLQKKSLPLVEYKNLFNFFKHQKCSEEKISFSFLCYLKLILYFCTGHQ